MGAGIKSEGVDAETFYMPEPLFSALNLEQWKPSEVDQLVRHPHVSNNATYVRRILDAVLSKQLSLDLPMKGTVPHSLVVYHAVVAALEVEECESAGTFDLRTWD